MPIRALDESPSQAPKAPTSTVWPNRSDSLFHVARQSHRPTSSILNSVDRGAGPSTVYELPIRMCLPLGDLYRLQPRALVSSQSSRVLFIPHPICYFQIDRLEGDILRHLCPSTSFILHSWFLTDCLHSICLQVSKTLSSKHQSCQPLS